MLKTDSGWTEVLCMILIPFLKVWRYCKIKVFLKDSSGGKGQRTGIKWEWPLASGICGPASTSRQRQALGSWAHQQVQPSQVTQRQAQQGQRSLQKWPMRRSTREQGSIPLSLPPAPRGHLGRRGRRGRRGNLWDGRCQPDAEFKFSLAWAFTSPTPSGKPETLPKRLSECWTDDVIFNWQLNVFFLILKGDESSKAKWAQLKRMKIHFWMKDKASPDPTHWKHGGWDLLSL